VRWLVAVTPVGRCEAEPSGLATSVVVAWQRGSADMTDNSGTADDESNRITALAALYHVEQSTLNTLDGQTLVMVGLLVTYGMRRSRHSGQTAFTPDGCS
jgi:hypothetical protein